MSLFGVDGRVAREVMEASQRLASVLVARSSSTAWASTCFNSHHRFLRRDPGSGRYRRAGEYRRCSMRCAAQVESLVITETGQWSALRTAALSGQADSE